MTRWWAGLTRLAPAFPGSPLCRGQRWPARPVTRLENFPKTATIPPPVDGKMCSRARGRNREEGCVHVATLAVGPGTGIAALVTVVPFVVLPLRRTRTASGCERWTPGKVYRSGQMTVRGFVEAVQRYHIRTIINLQDEYPDPDVTPGLFQLAHRHRKRTVQATGRPLRISAPDLIARRLVPEHRPAAIDRFLAIMDDPGDLSRLAPLPGRPAPDRRHDGRVPHGVRRLEQGAGHPRAEGQRLRRVRLLVGQRLHHAVHPDVPPGSPRAGTGASGRQTTSGVRSVAETRMCQTPHATRWPFRPPDWTAGGNPHEADRPIAGTRVPQGLRHLPRQPADACTWSWTCSPTSTTSPSDTPRCGADPEAHRHLLRLQGHARSSTGSVRSIVLLAATFTMALVQRNNELLPLLSAGVSTRRVVRPILLARLRHARPERRQPGTAHPRIGTYLDQLAGRSRWATRTCRSRGPTSPTASTSRATWLRARAWS